MLSTAIIFIIKIIAVIALLTGMVVVLFGIGHLSRNDNKRDYIYTEQLRKEVDKSSNNLSTHNVFHSFLARSELEKGKSKK